MAGGFFGAKFLENAKKIKELYEAFGFAMSTEVVVGITDETNSSRENGITNAELLYLHENGVPSHNIPPRPVLKPAIAQDGVRENIQSLMKQGLKEAFLHANKAGAEQYYHKAGMIGRDAAKKYITAGTNLAPNAESTIRRKGSSVPLIDKASMLNSITYAVRKKR